MTWKRVCSSGEVPENSNKAFMVDGRDVLIARTAMGLFAVGATCSHQQQPLEGGKLKACFLFCPHHGVRFDLRDGSPAGTLTDRPLPTFAVREIGDDVLIEINGE